MTPPAGPSGLSSWRTRYVGREARWVAVSLWACLFVWRWSILDSPPYWDQAQGLWTEANYLVETNFDYRRLLTEEPPGIEGGARVYVTSVLPTLLALVMRVCPNAQVTLWVWHLLGLAFSAITVAASYRLVRQRGSVVDAWWGAALVLTTPLFSAQIDLAGLDMPLAMCTTLAACAWTERRPAWALAWSTAAFASKPSGQLITASLALCIAGHAWVRWRRVRTTTIIDAGVPWASLLLGSLALLAVEAWLVHWAAAVPTLAERRHVASFAHLGMLPIWAPDLLVLMLLVGVGCMVFWGMAQRGPRASTSASSQDVLTDDDESSRVLRAAQFALALTFVELTAIAWVLLQPRYLLPLVPVLWGLLLLLAGSWIRWNALRWPVLMGLVIFNLANQEGRFFPPPETGLGPHLARTGAVLERSREYLRDHRANIGAMEVLAKHAATEPVIVGHDFTYFAAFPRLGYVQRPLQGFTINPFTRLPTTFQDITAVAPDQLPRRVWFVTTGNTWYHQSARLRMPFPEADDRIVFDDPGPARLVVFRRQWNETETPDAQLADWYLEHLRPWAPAAERAAAHCRFLQSRGRAGEALRVARRVAQAEAHEPAVWALLLEQLRIAGRTLEAIRVSLDGRTAPSGDSDAKTQANPTPAATGTEASGDANWQRGCDDFFQGRTAEAVRQWRATLEQNPRHRSALVAMGLVSEANGQEDEALARFRQAIESDPALAPAWEGVGRIALRAHRLTEAVDALERAAQCDPESYPARQDLARALYQLGDNERAEEALREAARIFPESQELAELQRAVARPPD